MLLGSTSQPTTMRCTYVKLAGPDALLLLLQWLLLLSSVHHVRVLVLLLGRRSSFAATATAGLDHLCVQVEAVEDQARLEALLLLEDLPQDWER